MWIPLQILRTTLINQHRVFLISSPMKRSEAVEKMKAVIRRKHLALATEDNYCHWLRRFLEWVSSHPSCPVDPAKRMEGFLSDLARSDVAASTQNQAFSAVLFFYRHVLGQEPGRVDALRAKRPQFLHHAPAKPDVLRLLDAVQDTPLYPYRLIACLIYGAGLRVSEPLCIRIRDIDLGSRRLVIRQAKQHKDRLVPIPSVLVDPITRQISAARVVWHRAVAAQVPVKLPHQLGKKYRSAGFEFPWFWLFPAAESCADPRTGDRVWWRCLESGVQKAVRRAAVSAGLGSSITPHHLRHAWATHAIDAGASVRDLQAILGHRSLETTMIYVHPEIERVQSPLDALRVAL